MAQKKQKFSSREWECVDAEVEMNSPKETTFYFYGNIPSKKNQRQNFWRVSLPSANYIEWHKRILEKLKWKARLIWLWPFEIDIQTIYHSRRRKDCDNVVSSILDTLQDLWVIPDDDNETVRKITVTNAGYVKNAPITKIVVKQYNDDKWLNDETDYKGTNLKQLKHLFINK